MSLLSGFELLWAMARRFGLESDEAPGLML